MTVVSKPYKVSMRLLGSYLSALYMNPIRTKSLTAATIAVLGNLTSQHLSNAKEINFQTVGAFGLYGLLFGGSIPHFFYEALNRFIDSDAKGGFAKMILIERLLFMPLLQFFSLYTLNRFELKSHSQAVSSALRFYPDIVEANFKYLSLLQFANLYFVPPVLRVLVNNLIGFFWVIFLARKRSPAPRKGKGSKA